MLNKLVQYADVVVSPPESMLEMLFGKNYIVILLVLIAVLIAAAVIAVVFGIKAYIKKEREKESVKVTENDPKLR